MSLQNAGKLALIKMIQTHKTMTHGNLSGRKPDTRQIYSRLTREQSFQVQQADYAIYSYSTPIAWYRLGAWIQPEAWYSRTTANHQSVLRGLLCQIPWELGNTQLAIQYARVSTPPQHSVLGDHDNPETDQCIVCFYEAMPVTR